MNDARPVAFHPAACIRPTTVYDAEMSVDVHFFNPVIYSLTVTKTESKIIYFS